MKYRTLESMRQVRLMLTEVVIPVGTAVVTLEATHPGCIKNTYNKAKSKVTKTFKSKKKDDKVVQFKN